MLMIVMGLPGTGKSTLAFAIAQQTGIAYLSSDRTRDRLGMRGEYKRESKDMIYSQLLKETESLLREGKPVIIDASFNKEYKRKPFRELANRYKQEWIVVEMYAPENVIQERTKKQREFSEADFKVYQKIKQEYEKPIEPSIRLDSSTLSLEQQIRHVKPFFQPESELPL